jgi:hypothetical protein
MATSKYRVFKFGGLNIHTSPFLHLPGELISCINVDPNPHGAKQVREGYTTYLGTANGSAVTDLFNFRKNDGTTFWNYRVSGGTIYSSVQGTGVWTATSGGTVGGQNVGHAVLGDKLFIGDGVNPIKYTSDGTTFGTMALAPTGEFLAEYQKRIYVGGTASTLFYSTSLDGTNWNTSGTSDSSSFDLGGGGKLGKIFVANDRLNITKNNQRLYRWDGYSLLTVPSNQGPTSPYSLGEIENYWFWLNRNGYMSYYGAMPEIISIPIEHQITNQGDSGGIVGSQFTTAKGIAHRYQYYCSVGDVSEDLAGETITNCVHIYDYIHNEWCDYSYYNKPLSWLSYVDNSGVPQLVFGASGGQCYQIGGTSDNGYPIVSEIQGVLNFGIPDMDKKFSFMRVHFNPGCSARMQVAITDTFNTASKNWIDLGDLQTGFKKMAFPQGSRGKLLFYKITDSNTVNPFKFYGLAIDWEEQGF